MQAGGWRGRVEGNTMICIMKYVKYVCEKEKEEGGGGRGGNGREKRREGGKGRAGKGSQFILELWPVQ